MKSDCLTTCCMSIVKDITSVLLTSSYPFRKELLPNHFSPYNHDNFQKSRHANIQCYKICEDQCFNEYYLNQVESIVNGSKLSTKIQIRRNAMVNVIVTHMPEMSFMSLLCNFGGLVSMWMGISIVGVCDDLCYLFHTVVIKIISFRLQKIKSEVIIARPIIKFIIIEN